MTDTNEVLRRISDLERSSRRAVPFGLVAVAAILGSSYLGSQELMRTRAAVAEAEVRLQQVREETQAVLDETQTKLDALNSTLAGLSAKAGDPSGAGVRSALEQVATIDASLAVAGGRVAASSTPSAPTRYGGMSVDVFYCADAGPASKSAAESAQSLQQNNSMGRWRIRELSRAINATAGYQVRTDVIRFNPDERDIATRLAADLETLLGSQVALQEIAYPTPGYISVFLCGTRQ